MDTKELERSLSMDEILKTIRSVVSEGMEKEEKKEEDILELTEIVEVGNLPSPDLKNIDKSKDILQTIDDVIGEKKEEAKQPVSIEPVHSEITLTPSSEITENKNTDKIINSENNQSKIQEKKSDESSFFESKDINVEDSESETNHIEDSSYIENVNESLLSNEVLEASAKALKSLIGENKTNEKIEDWGSKLTLEELVIRMLKPELSKWLDKNLPSIIQKIVEKEIKKIIPKIKK